MSIEKNESWERKMTIAWN